MTKKELITAMSGETGLSLTDTQETFSAFIAVVTGALIQGDKIALPGFGTFTSKHRAQREGRNPQTGEVLTIAASNIPTFKAGKTLKDALN
ncbi:MAG TPA: HU family DNA-binding protein [Candidatus Thioglobus sp.]|nr:HU family DNA-binding protein [Candidatus Thioglobus sp.]